MSIFEIVGLAILKLGFQFSRAFLKIGNNMYTLIVISMSEKNKQFLSGC